MEIKNNSHYKKRVYYIHIIISYLLLSVFVSVTFSCLMLTLQKSISQISIPTSNVKKLLTKIVLKVIETLMICIFYISVIVLLIFIVCVTLLKLVELFPKSFYLNLFKIVKYQFLACIFNFSN